TPTTYPLSLHAPLPTSPRHMRYDPLCDRLVEAGEVELGEAEFRPEHAVRVRQPDAGDGPGPPWGHGLLAANLIRRLVLTKTLIRSEEHTSELQSRGHLV